MHLAISSLKILLNLLTTTPGKISSSERISSVNVLYFSCRRPFNIADSLENISFILLLFYPLFL
jgi:hypothetical protein